MAEKKIWLIAGLGNPGDSYKNTRHNAGFMVVDELAETYTISLGQKKADAIIGRGRVEDVDVILAKPMSYMNRSGFPVRSIANYFRIPGDHLLVIHDDIDIAFGKIKIKEKGGHGGHKGLKSLMDAFGGGDFPRLRIGVGRSEQGIGVADYVLGKFDHEERRHLEQIAAQARDAVVTILCKGTKEGMNRFNNKSIMI